MICQSCIDAPQGECQPVCVNTAKGTKTWCDCMHSHGPCLDQNLCKHLNWLDENKSCPGCGMTYKMYYQRESARATREAMEGAANDG